MAEELDPALQWYEGITASMPGLNKATKDHAKTINSAADAESAAKEFEAHNKMMEAQAEARKNPADQAQRDAAEAATAKYEAVATPAGRAWIARGL
jgi:putative IMPACT (imprinted ancient) family translation regulator